MCLIVDFEASGEWGECKVWKRLIESCSQIQCVAKLVSVSAEKKETPSRLFPFHSRLRKNQKFLRTKGNSIRKELKLIIFLLLATMWKSSPELGNFLSENKSIKSDREKSVHRKTWKFAQTQKRNFTHSFSSWSFFLLSAQHTSSHSFAVCDWVAGRKGKNI